MLKTVVINKRRIILFDGSPDCVAVETLITKQNRKKKFAVVKMFSKFTLS